jgi:hypothetical protein
MSEKPKRLGQLHLSTVVVLSLLAGALLGLNLRAPHISSAYVDKHNRKIVVVNGEGWPVPREYITYANIDPTEALTHYQQGRIFKSDGAIEVGHWHLLWRDWPTYVENIVVGSIIIVATMVLLERQIHRGEARKT